MLQEKPSLRGLLPEPRLPAVFQGLTGEYLKDKLAGILAEARCNLLYIFTRTLLENYGLPDEMEWPVEGFLVTGDRGMLMAPQLALSEQGHGEELSDVKLMVSGFSPATTKQHWEELWPLVRPILQRHGWRQPPNRAETTAQVHWHLVALRKSRCLSWGRALELLQGESKRFRTMEPEHAIRSAIRLDKELKPKRTLMEMMEVEEPQD